VGHLRVLAGGGERGGDHRESSGPPIAEHRYRGPEQHQHFQHYSRIMFRQTARVALHERVSQPRTRMPAKP
jgi:hypothetical protein